MTTASSPWVLGARSETGFVRSTNEDRMGWSRTPYGDVFVVSDGMGGYRGGALAAEITVRALQDHLASIAPDSERFGDQTRRAFEAANREVYDQRRPDDEETREMGATGVALVSRGARIIVGHVGDSRAYLWRAGSGLRQLTRDHTRVQTMVDAGLITVDEAAAHPDASVLDRAIGHQPDVQVDVTDWIDLEPGDLLLLCSDGLCGYVTDAEIDDILRAGDGPQATTDRLVQRALDKGGHDNVTVQLMRFTPSRRAGSPSRLLSRPIVLVPVSVAITALAATLGIRVAGVGGPGGSDGQGPASQATPAKTSAIVASRPEPAVPTATAPSAAVASAASVPPQRTQSSAAASPARYSPSADKTRASGPKAASRADTRAAKHPTVPAPVPVPVPVPASAPAPGASAASSASDAAR